VGASIAAQKPEAGAHPELVAFDPVEFAQLTALCDLLCPGKPGVFPSSKELDLPALVDKHLSSFDADTIAQLKTAVGLVDNALLGAVMAERLRPISSLGLEGRASALNAFRDSAVGFRRTLYHAVSSLVMSVYWTQPGVEQGAGYNGPPPSAHLRATYSENLVDYTDLRAKRKASDV
jgi:hypothetical protein